MKITNGVRIATANKILCVKTLIARLVVTLIMIFSVFNFAKLIFEPIFKSEELKVLLNLIRETIKNFIIMQPETTASADFKNAFSNLLSFIYSKMSSIVWVSIGIIIVMQVIQFLYAICDYIIGVNINEHMSSMRHAGFFSTLIENFKNACRYALCKTLFLFIYNTITIVLVVLIFIALIGKLGIFTLSLILFLSILFVAIKLSFIGQVLPKIVCENKKPFNAFKEAVKEADFYTFMQRALSYFIMSIVVYVVSTVASIVSFGVSYLVVLPLSSVIFVTLRFVDYYTINHKKYYVTFDMVVVPKELRQNDEHLLNQVDI